MKVFHKSVLVEEILSYIDFTTKKIFADLTVGEGGHSYEIVKKMSRDSILVGFDLDPEILKVAEKRLGDGKNIILINENYKNFPIVIKRLNIRKVDFILLDLGFSSFHLQEGRGFSFRDSISIDMRYRKNVRSAEYIINTFKEKDLIHIFKVYGEVKEARKIARKIIEERKRGRITTGKKLAEIVESALPYKKDGLHPATRVFQALRIYVNKELENLSTFLSSFYNYLNKDGIVEIVSYHSLEDRMVKRKFMELERKGIIKILTRKPITPKEEEIEENIRSRSAKLRVAKRI